MLDPSSERQYRDFSSVGRRRALGDRALQAAGHRFETGTLHSKRHDRRPRPAVVSRFSLHVFPDSPGPRTAEPDAAERLPAGTDSVRRGFGWV